MIEAINPGVRCWSGNPCVAIGPVYVEVSCAAVLSPPSGYTLIAGFSGASCNVSNVVLYRAFPPNTCVSDSSSSFLSNCTSNSLVVCSSTSACSGSTCRTVKESPNVCTEENGNSFFWDCSWKSENA